MTIPKTGYKIALIGYTLNNGGLEKVISNLSLLLHENNVQVHNIILNDDVGYPYYGKLVNVSKRLAQFPLGKFSKYWYLFYYFRKYKFDYIIDLRYRLNPLTEFVFCKVIYNTNVIYSVHSSRIENYFFNNKRLTRLLYNRNFAIVCSSRGIEKELRKRHALNNVTTIYNPIAFDQIRKKADSNLDLDFKYIIAVGRFEKENIKQFDKLIITYLESNLQSTNTHLVLIGKGETFSSMKLHFAQERFVHFEGFKENPYVYMNKSIFFVLCSKYEGFGMVLAEALASGVPVVSFDCYTGPNEIVKHEKNGLLVEDQNFNALKLAIERLNTDSELLEKCKMNAENSVLKFDIKHIAKEWFALFNK